jgi:hypothetical protein
VSALLIAGGAGGAEIVRCNTSVSLPFAFVAPSSMSKLPVTAGVPEIVFVLALKESPAGNALLTVNVGVGAPLAATV